MNHHATSKFWKRYENLPEAIQGLADKNFDLLKIDPSHPSLYLKAISGKDNLWSARVGDHFRVLALSEEDEFYWFWIGTHADYDKLITQ